MTNPVQQDTQSEPRTETSASTDSSSNRPTTSTNDDSSAPTLAPEAVPATVVSGTTASTQAVAAVSILGSSSSSSSATSTGERSSSGVGAGAPPSEAPVAQPQPTPVGPHSRSSTSAADVSSARHRRDTNAEAIGTAGGAAGTGMTQPRPGGWEQQQRTSGGSGPHQQYGGAAPGGLMSFSRAFDLFMSPLAVPASGSGGGVGGAGAGGPLSGGLDGTASSGQASVKGGLGPLHGSTTNGAGSPVANGSGSNSSNGGFFIPSYLRNSTYVQRLAAAHEARQRAIREGLLTHPAPAAVRSASVSNGVVAGAVASKAPDPGVVSIGPSPCYGPGLTRPLPARMTHPGRRRTLPQDVGQPSPSSKQRGAGGSTFDLVSRTGGAAAGATYNPYALEYEDETLTPLPSRWNPSDKWGGLEVLGPDGLEVKHTATRSGSERDHEACSIRADHFIPPQCGFYYFEVTILTRKRDETTIGIGFSTKSVLLSRVPGWEPESWGYHGDDGNSFAAQNVGKHYGPTFTTGDTIGCGINFRIGTAFFTKNGVALGTAFRDIKGTMKLYPSVGLKKTGEHVRINFGQTPFVYDIDAYMRKEREIVAEKIHETSTSKLTPHLSETELIQTLVLQFLQQEGYVETARAFAKEIHNEKKALRLNSEEHVEGISIRDDEDAHNRQRIRRCVLEGDIDRALELTRAYYPQVLKEHDGVYFRLRCRKFVEMVRKAAEMSNGDSSAAPPPRNGTLGRDDMELDDEMMDADDGALAASSSSGFNLTREMETVRLLQETLAYGQELAAEFKDDGRPEVAKALDDIFALIAYPNPLKAKEVSHLLDRNGRAAVAEELNSAILLSLGKSSRSALENLYAQTSVLLDDLRQEGGPGAFVNLRGLIEDIPKFQS